MQRPWRPCPQTCQGAEPAWAWLAVGTVTCKGLRSCQLEVSRIHGLRVSEGDRTFCPAHLGMRGGRSEPLGSGVDPCPGLQP